MRHCTSHPNLHDRSQPNQQGPPAPRARFFEEPGAVVPHAGICERGVRATGVLASIAKNMKRKIILAAIGIALLTLGFVSGRFVQHCKSGYHYEVRGTKDYDSPVGPIRWSCVTESVGMPFLDSGTTILELDGRIIYKAKRSFQESSPYARNIRSTQEGVAWDDGDFLFDLTIHKMKTGEQTVPPNQSLPPSSNSTSPVRGSEDSTLPH